MAIAPFTWEGDNARAIEWLPFAESALMALAACANGMMMQQCHQPESDVLIMLQVNPHNIFIRAINPAYMETGFIGVGSTAAMVDLTYQPSQILFNSLIREKSFHSKHNKAGWRINASRQREVWDGDQSWAIGCAQKVDHITVYNYMGEAFSFYSSAANPLFCEPARLFARKYAVANTPP
ncbi:MAG: hypothetical protein ACKO0Z_11430, partial [Betaproteobacteria bacterium]